MVLFRYVSKEILTAVIAVTAVLLIIFLSNQMVHYLNDAVEGKLAARILVNLILLQFPYLLGLLLPIGLFFGVLLVLSRFYVDNEMAVLMASGMSRGRLISMVMLTSLGVAIVIGVLTLYVNPLIAAHRDQVADTASEQAVVSTLMPGRFQHSPDGRRVFYIQQSGVEGVSARNVFMAEMPDKFSPEKGDHWTIVSADDAMQTIDQRNGAQFLVAKKGYRYEGTPGEQDYLVIKFDDYGVRLNPVVPKAANDDEQAKTTWALLMAGWQNLNYVAELEWRLSVPVVALCLAFLAVPLSQVRPREGKYAQLFPGVLICIFYVNLLFVARAWVENGKLSPLVGLWWVHGLVILLALALFAWQRWRR